MSQNLKISFLLICSFILTTCQSGELPLVKTTLQGKTMGTAYNITLVSKPKESIDKSLLSKNIEEKLVEINQQFSTYEDTSTISQFNRYPKDKWFDINHAFYTVISTAQKIAIQSNGFFDVTVKPLVNLWGFGKQTKMTVPDDLDINKALSKVGYQHIHLNIQNDALKKQITQLTIDLSSIVKGYAVDVISRYLDDKGFKHYLVEIGGEIRTTGLNEKGIKWQIAIQHPDSIKLSKGFALSDVSLATSGDYQNYYIDGGVRKSHIINPNTGYPIAHKLASVTVLHKSAMFADAYATAILVMGEELGKAFVKERSLDVVMIIREEEKYVFWSNIDSFR